MDDEPPRDEEEPTSGRPPSEHEPPTGKERVDRDRGDEGASDEEPAARGEPEPLWMEPPLSGEPADEPASAAPEGPEGAADDQEDGGTGEGGETPGPHEEEAETDELPIEEEVPWGGASPPWERNPAWELGSPTDLAPVAEGEAVLGEELPPDARAELRQRRARERLARRRAGQRRLIALIAALVIIVVIIVVVTATGSSPSRPPRFLGSLAAHPGKGRSYLAVATDTSELPLNVLIADRNNDRLLSISPHGQVVWQRPEDVPSDAYLSRTGHTVVVTEPARSTVVARVVDSYAPVYEYGHAGRAGSKDGHLRDPQTAQFTEDGEIVVADEGNCRVLFLSEAVRSKPVRQLGTTGVCSHHVTSNPATDTFAYPDAAFPTADGGLIVTESNPAWVDVLSKSGALVSAVALQGLSAPSDANEDPDDSSKVIVTDRTHPGEVVEFDYSSVSQTLTPLWTYKPTSGPDELDKPTIARVLAGGDVLIADSGNDRVIVVRPTGTTTGTIVWQYGHTAKPGRAPGYLHTPDSVTLVPNEPPG